MVSLEDILKEQELKKLNNLLKRKGRKISAEQADENEKRRLMKQAQ